MTFSLLYSGSVDIFYFLLKREQHMSRSVTSKISCAHSENIDQHSPSLISVFNINIKEVKIKIKETSRHDARLTWRFSKQYTYRELR